MSDLAIVVICLTVIVATAIVSATYYALKKPDPIEESRQRLLVAEDRLSEALARPRGKDLWLPREEPEPKPDSMAPAPFDPENPPRERTYQRRANSIAPVPRCFCHDRDLQSGQKILWWPVPDSEEVRIYCQREDS